MQENVKVLAVLVILLLAIVGFSKFHLGEIVPAYTVSIEGAYTLLKNQDGTEVARNTDALTIINQAITLGSSVLIKGGSYPLTGSINMKSNVMVYVQLNASFTVTAFTYTSRRGVVDFRGVTNAHFTTETDPASESAYPVVNCLGTSNYECGVLMLSESTYCSVGPIKFINPGGYGISLYHAHHNTFDRTYVYGFCKRGGDSHQGLDLRAATYNTFDHIHIDANLIPGSQITMYFGGDQGEVAYNDVIGGIFENSPYSHAAYWCSEGGVDSVHHNRAWGGISRHCLGTPYVPCGFKLNPASNSIIGVRPDGTIDPWIVYDCWCGLQMGDGGPGGSHDNLIYMNVINCRKGSEWFTQSNNQHVQNNEVHIKVDGNNPAYKKAPESGLWGLCFEGGSVQAASLIQYNTIYVEVRNVQSGGIVFINWDVALSETQQPIYNTFYCDIEVNNHAIYWSQGSNGWGTYNTFYLQHIQGAPGNCPTIPNAEYVYTDSQSFIPNIATNSFLITAPQPLTSVHITPETPQTIYSSQSVIFNAVADGGGSLTYAWYVDQTLQQGTSQIFTFMGSSYSLNTHQVYCTCSNTTATVTSNMVQVTIVEQQLDKWNIAISSTTGGSTSPTGAISLNTSDSLSVSATASAGYFFIHWESDISAINMSETNPLTVAPQSVGSTHTLLAVFEANTTPPPPPPPELPSVPTEYLFIGGVIAVAAIIVWRRKQIF